MKAFKVIVNGESVDLYDANDLDLAITLAIADSNNITTRKKSNTKTIKFPATGNNKLIFGHPEDINSVVEIDQQSKPSVIIEADGTEIFKGYIKIQSTSNINDKIIEYVGTCIGTNGDWIQRIGDAKLNELDYSDQNHTNNIATVNASETIVSGREYVYDLIDRGEFTGQLYDYAGVQQRGVNIQDRFPGLNIFGMVTRVYKEIGYKVVSTFLSSSFFTKLYWMFVNEELKHPDSVNATLACLAQTTTIQKKIYPATSGVQYASITMKIGAPFTTILSNPSGALQFSNPGEYFCLGRGKYTFKTIIISKGTAFGYPNNDNVGGISKNTAATVLFTYKKINRYKGTSITVCGSDANSAVYSRPNTNGVASFPTVTFEKSFDLEFGDEVFVEALYSFVQVLGNEYFQVDNYTFECTKVEGKLGIGENQYIDWAYNLPDTLQLDFIQGLKELFNLHFTTDTDSRTVYIEPRDEFYNGEVQDLSAKLDNNKEITTEFLGSTLSKTLRYRYKHDSNDKIVELWEKQNGKVFGAEDSQLGNAFAKDDTSELENKVFAPTWMEECARIGIKGVPLPKMWADVNLPKRSQKFEPRILYYAGIQSMATGLWRMNPNGTVKYQTDNPVTNPLKVNGSRTTFPLFYSFDDSQVNDNNLMYDDRHYSSGLFQKHFRNAQKVLDDARQFSCYINFDDTDISNIDFRRPVYIEKNGNGAYFILDKISDYKSNGESTLCVMTKIVPTQLIKALRYSAGLPILTFSVLPDATQGIALSPSGNGTVVVSGLPYTTRSTSGSVVQGGGEVLTLLNGTLQTVYFRGKDGKYEKVIMNTNR